MHIAIHSASEAVTRSLQALIAASGHNMAKADEPADLVLVDRLHPASQSLPTAPALYLSTSDAADDTTLACPIRPERLIQRLALYRTSKPLPLSHGWSLDVMGRLLHHTENAPLSLTEKEVTLLQRLIEAHPTPLSREALLEEVWGMSGNVDTHTLETHIYRLRAKLSSLTPLPCDILTENGAYGLVLPAENG